MGQPFIRHPKGYVAKCNTMHLRLIKRRLIKYKYVPHMLKTLQAVYQYSKSPPTYLVVQHKTNRAVRFTSLKSTQLWTMDSGMSLSSQAPHRDHPYIMSANMGLFGPHPSYQYKYSVERMRNRSFFRPTHPVLLLT